MQTTEKNTRIIKICGDELRRSVKDGGCGNCRASCQSACKTSCTVANQSCERVERDAAAQ
jgi:predicted ribosomally synthesized six-cysteine peptide SCIFF